MRRTVVCAILWTVLLALPVSADTLHVPDEYPLILDAMVFATYGDTVLVECGIYNEGNIQMKSGVTLISETGEVGCALIDAQNMSRVIECVDCDDTTVIKGFTIAGGYVTSSQSYGAGISCLNSSPQLENLDIIVCQVRAVDGYGGGGLGCLHSSPSLTNVEFRGCVVVDATAHGGGAMSVLGVSSPTLNDVRFKMNWTTDSFGGALSIEAAGTTEVRLNNVSFTENSAATSGGGVYVGSGVPIADGLLFYDNWAPEGGGVHLASCRNCTLSNVTFRENTAASGGGGGLLDGTTPDGRLTLSNASFLDNTAATGGGGMACSSSNLPSISYATFARNSANTGGGLDVAGSTITISNTTFYGNAASAAGGGGGINLDAGSSLNLNTSIIAYSTSGEAVAQPAIAPPVVTCTDVYGNAGGDWVGILAGQGGINGNLWVDPLFCDAYSDTFDLAADSECLPGNNTCGLLMGAWGAGCPPSTGLDEVTSAVAVHPASPNPFGHTTALCYELPTDTAVSVRVFDVSGKLVRTLADGERQAAGPNALVWNGRDNSGRQVASGVYFFRVDVGGDSIERRTVLLR